MARTIDLAMISIVVSFVALGLSGLSTYMQFFYESLEIRGSLERIDRSDGQLSNLVFVIYNSGTESILVVSPLLRFKHKPVEKTWIVEPLPPVIVSPKDIKEILVPINDSRDHMLRAFREAAGESFGLDISLEARDSEAQSYEGRFRIKVTGDLNGKLLRWTHNLRPISFEKLSRPLTEKLASGHR